MKNVLLFSLAFISFYYSFAIPPTPNEYSLKVNAASEIIVEATVIKRDTVNVSENESYFLFTLNVINVFKDKHSKVDKTVQVLMKRDLEWEYSGVQYDITNPRYLLVGDKYILFLQTSQTLLKGVKNDKPYYSFYDKFIDSRVTFFTNNTIAAYGLSFTFITLEDLYGFIKLLPETSVPANLTDTSQSNKLEHPNGPYADSLTLKQIKHNIRVREEYQRLHIPSKD